MCWYISGLSRGVNYAQLLARYRQKIDLTRRESYTDDVRSDVWSLKWTLPLVIENVSICVVCYRVQWTSDDAAVLPASATDERRSLIGRLCRSWQLWTHNIRSTAVSQKLITNSQASFQLRPTLIMLMIKIRAVPVGFAK